MKPTKDAIAVFLALSRVFSPPPAITKLIPATTNPIIDEIKSNARKMFAASVIVLNVSMPWMENSEGCFCCSSTNCAYAKNGERNNTSKNEANFVFVFMLLIIESELLIFKHFRDSKKSISLLF